MSKASITGQIVVTSNGTTIYPILQCTTGDVNQNYDGEWNAPTQISPDFEASGARHPVLVMQAFSAEQGAGNNFDLTRGSTTWVVGGVTKRVNILPTSSTNLFTITEKGGSCTVKAEVTEGTSVTSSGYTFKWYLPDSTNAWVLKQDSDSPTFTINETDVDSSILVMCEAYKAGSFYASDTQTVNDVSDEYIIFPNPTDGNGNAVAENFIQNSGGSIVYVPYMRKRGSNTNIEDVTFSMALYSNSGIPISGAPTVSDNKFTVTESAIRAYKGAVYVITGVK
ncbi:MAG: hypothetical protein KHY47_14670 [Prevotella sp.]|nr:hypothetical protein [Prevotella sp.]